MVARLLLMLLLAAFALPNAAPAACHDMASATHAMPMPMPAGTSDDHAAPVHACIGCIPPSDWLNPRLASPALPPAATPFATAPVRLAGLALPPTIPPPQYG